MKQKNKNQKQQKRKLQPCTCFISEHSFIGYVFISPTVDLSFEDWTFREYSRRKVCLSVGKRNVTCCCYKR